MGDPDSPEERRARTVRCGDGEAIRVAYAPEGEDDVVGADESEAAFVARLVARDETAFKRYLRRHQVPTVVWYTAYPRLHAPRIDRNAALRHGLAGHPDQTQAAEWLALL